MKFAIGQFSQGDAAPFLGIVLGDEVLRGSELCPGLIGLDTRLLDLLQQWDSSFSILKVAVEQESGLAKRFQLKELRAHAPISLPPQIFCAGANYSSHLIRMITALGGGPATEGMNEDQRREYAEDLCARQRVEGSPFVFMKPSTSVADPVGERKIPSYTAKYDWELELAAVIGKPTYRVDHDVALDHVAGYMIINDLTARDKVHRSDPGAISHDWMVSKGGYRSMPSGPLFVPAPFVENPHDLAMSLTVNGVIMQAASTGEMTFDIPRQIEFISSHIQMLPGDILCTGTPGGTGIEEGRFIKEGDLLECEIEGLGRQSVRFVGKGD